MVRSTASLLVVVMLLASGRLLACGWECADELAVPAEVSCHQDSSTGSDGLPTVTVANPSDTMHACLPDVAEPRVTVVKTFKAQDLVAAASVAAFTHAPSTSFSSRRPNAFHQRFSPHSPPPTILRI